jgi:hypothetical protein
MGMDSWDVGSLSVITGTLLVNVQQRLAKGKGNCMSGCLEAFGAPVA